MAEIQFLPQEACGLRAWESQFLETEDTFHIGGLDKQFDKYLDFSQYASPSIRRERETYIQHLWKVLSSTLASFGLLAISRIQKDHSFLKILHPNPGSLSWLPRKLAALKGQTGNPTTKLQLIFHAPLNRCQMLMNLTQYHPGAGFCGQEVKSFQVYDIAGHTLYSSERRFIFWGKTRSCHQRTLGHQSRCSSCPIPQHFSVKASCPMGLWCFVKTNEHLWHHPPLTAVDRGRQVWSASGSFYMYENPPNLFELSGLKCQP